MADSPRTTLSIRERNAPSTALVPAEELKEHLPGVEPERQLNDWGRSERIEGIYDRLVADFFYRYWFRAEVEGIENVPWAGLRSGLAGGPQDRNVELVLRDPRRH